MKRLRSVDWRCLARAAARLRSVQLPRRRPPRLPRLPERVTGYVVDCWDAAKYEPRVAMGGMVAASLYGGLLLTWLYMAVVEWETPFLFRVIAVLFLTLVINTGIVLPLFVLIAWPRLKVRVWAIVETGIVVSFEKPRIRAEAKPGHIWRFGRERIIVHVPPRQGRLKPGELGGVMVTNRQWTLYSDIAVDNAYDKRRLTDRYRPHRTNWSQPVNALAWTVIILAGMFWTVAVAAPQGGA